MAHPFHLGTSTICGQRVFAASGDIDLAVASSFEQALLAALTATPRGGALALDMMAVDFFDSCATRSLAHAARTAAAADTALHISASPIVRRVLELTGVDLMPAIHLAAEHAEDRVV